MFRNRIHNALHKQVIAYFAWFCMLLCTYSPSPVQGDLCITEDNNEVVSRSRTAYVVAGLTIIGIAAGIVAFTTASGHHRHHVDYSNSSIDNYRPYSSSSYSSSYSDSSYSDSSESSSYFDSHQSENTNHSGYYSTNPYSIFSQNEDSSWSGESGADQRDLLFPRAKSCKSSISQTARSAGSLSGQLIVHSGNSSDQEGNLTAFVQLPDGSSRSLGTVPLSGNNCLSYGPFHEKGTYTFGVCLDQGNPSSMQMKVGSLQIAVNGSTVQRHDFTAPPRASANYEPAPCCFELNP